MTSSFRGLKAAGKNTEQAFPRFIIIPRSDVIENGCQLVGCEGLRGMRDPFQDLKGTLVCSPKRPWEDVGEGVRVRVGAGHVSKGDYKAEGLLDPGHWK